jgi:hypothetical protein
MPSPSPSPRHRSPIWPILGVLFPIAGYLVLMHILNNAPKRTDEFLPRELTPALRIFDAFVFSGAIVAACGLRGFKPRVDPAQTSILYTVIVFCVFLFDLGLWMYLLPAWWIH